MSARRFIHVTLGHVTSSTLSLGKSSLTPKTECLTTYLRQRVSWQVAWKPTLFRTYVTARVTRAPAVSNGRKLSDFVCSVLNHHIRHNNLSRLLHRNTPRQRPKKKPITRPAELHQQFKKFVGLSADAILKSPKSILGVTLFMVAGAMHAYYTVHLVNLPLNDRQAFLMLTDEEALQKFDPLTAYKTTTTGTPNPRDSEGNSTEPVAARVEKVMKQLIHANPELTEYLIPGGQWEAVSVWDYKTMNFNPTCAFGNGTIFVAEKAMKKIDDDQLGFVIAHEMIQVIQKHAIEKTGTTIFFCEFFNNVLKPMVDFFPGFDVKVYLRDFVEKFDFADSKTAEREADEFGFKFACKACFDYRKFGDGLEQLRKTQVLAKRRMMRSGREQGPDGPEHAAGDNDWDKPELLSGTEDWDVPEPVAGTDNWDVPEPVAGTDDWDVPEPLAGTDDWDVREPVGEDDQWDPHVLNEVMQTDFYFHHEHPVTSERVALVQSEEWWLKAEAWRQEKGCTPFQETSELVVQPLSQRVDEHDASRSPRLQSQREPYSPIQTAQL